MPASNQITESRLPPRDHQHQDIKAARAVWDDIAARARALHCPTHFVEPWRVVVIGDTTARLGLQIYGCCPRLQEVVNELIDADPRVSGLR
jgi:hypothetical protein